MKTHRRCCRLCTVPIARWTVGIAVLVGGLLSPMTAAGQMTITEINPSQSMLYPLDANGASGGRVNGVAKDPKDSNILYAASEAGGLYKSTNAGHTWTRLNNHRPTMTWDVAVSPIDSQRVIATSGYDGRVTSLAGINLSHDGGATWSHPPTALPDPTVCLDPGRRTEPSAFGISIDPDHPQNIYIGTNCGLAISNDGGATWHYVDPAKDELGIIPVIYDVIAHHGGIIDLCGGAGHSRSKDGGTSWSTVRPMEQPLPSGRCSIAVAPDEPDVLFAAVGIRILESHDGGMTWQIEYKNPSPQGRIPFVTINNRKGSAFDLWFGDKTLWRAPCTTLASPAPGSKPAPHCADPVFWELGAAGAHVDMGALVFSGPRNVDVTVTDTKCTQNCAVQEQACLADAHSPAEKQACIAERRECTALCTEVKHLVGDPCPLVVSSDGGVYFNKKLGQPVTTPSELEHCQTPQWHQPDVSPHALWLFGMDGAHLAGLSAEFLYVGAQDNGLFVTTNAGDALPAWDNVESGDRFQISADAQRVLYVTCCAPTGRTKRLFLRTPGLTGGGEIKTYPPGELLAGGYTKPLARFGSMGYIVLTDAGVFVTHDITATPKITWEQLGAQDNTPVNACAVQVGGPHAAPAVYVLAGACTGSRQDKLFRYDGTLPGGLWKRIDPPPTPTGNIIGGFGIFAADPGENADRLFASHLRPKAAGGPQMLLSSDGGKTWMLLPQLDKLMTGAGTYQYQNSNGPNLFTNFQGYVQPTLVAFNPSQPSVLLAGGADSGLFLSKNGGTCWEVITNNAGTPQQPHLPRPRFAYFNHEPGRFEIYVGTQGRGVWRVTYSNPLPGQCVQ